MSAVMVVTPTELFVRGAVVNVKLGKDSTVVNADGSKVTEARGYLRGEPFKIAGLGDAVSVRVELPNGERGPRRVVAVKNVEYVSAPVEAASADETDENPNEIGSAAEALMAEAWESGATGGW